MSNEIKDYGELFCEAVDTIIAQRLNEINYDKTILCEIVDDTNKAKGEYTVSYNNTKFKAYSENTKYSKGNNVYVTIPNGDWKEQKNIVSKKTSDSEAPVSYIDPFQSFVNITGNLVTKTDSGKIPSLIANYNDTNKGNEKGYKADEILIWQYQQNMPEDNTEKKITDIGDKLSQYTRLAITAQFKSLLNKRAVSGSYGLLLRITRGEETAVTAENDILVFDSSEMIGDPYNYSSFYQQTKVFDIKDIYNIESMELRFYQQGNFKDKNDNYTTPMAGSEIWQPGGNSLLAVANPDLFVKDITISLGYDANEFENDTLKIFCLDNSQYTNDRTGDSNLVNNHKKLQVRWIHKMSNGSIQSVDQSDRLNHTLTWYKYKIGAAGDQHAGADWEVLSEQIVDGNTYNNVIKQQSWLNYNSTEVDGSDIPARHPTFNSSWLIPDIAYPNQRVKAILTYNDEANNKIVLVSNILTFTNKVAVADPETVAASSKLTIVCEDNKQGNYLIYTQGGSLINKKDSAVKRTFKAYFGGQPLQEATSIIWEIPKTATMVNIRLDDAISEKNPVTDNVDIQSTDNYHKIARYGNSQNGFNISHANDQIYYIKSQYTQTYNNNTIKCTVEKDGVTYTAIKDLTFGVAGTSGTDYTFILDFDDAVVLNASEPDKEISITARIYDYEGNDKTDSILDIPGVEIKWGWREIKKSDNTLTYVKDGLITRTKEENNKCTLKLTGNFPQSGKSYNIIQATLIGWGEYDLIAYLPIPICQNTKSKNNKDISPKYIDGTSEVLYNSAGEIFEYFKNPYVIYDKQTLQDIFNIDFIYDNNVLINDDIKNNVEWRVYYQIGSNSCWYDINSKNVINVDTKSIYNDNGYYKYAPSVEQGSGNNQYYLKPLSFFVKECCEKVCVVGIHKNSSNEEIVIWSQPILIMQNLYPSSMVNKWDGSLDVGNIDKGTVLAPRLVAGKKDDLNRFSGVMLGNWGKTISDNSLTQGETGLYGFHNGEMSYALKEDGTAFFGKSNKGRIYLNGDSGRIYSAGNKNIDEFDDSSYSSGVVIDLDDGWIMMNKAVIDALSIAEDTGIYLKGSMKVQSKDDSGKIVTAGTLGYTTMNSGNEEMDKSSHGIGMVYSEGNVDSQVKVTKSNAGLKYSNAQGAGGWVSIGATGAGIGTTNGNVLSLTNSPINNFEGYDEKTHSHLYCYLAAENQHGIYARFA